eukprot:6463583-Amphidinium_carterae.2
MSMLALGTREKTRRLKLNLCCGGLGGGHKKGVAASSLKQSTPRETTAQNIVCRSSIITPLVSQTLDWLLFIGGHIR